MIVIALLATWKALLAIGGGAWLTIAAVALLALVIGHLSGGHDREQRSVLAAFSVMRFPALALLIASILPRGRQLLPFILATRCARSCSPGSMAASPSADAAAHGGAVHEAHATA